MTTLDRTHARAIVADVEALGRESIDISHEDLIALSDALSPPADTGSAVGPYLDVDGVIRRGREYPRPSTAGRRIDDYPHSSVLGEGANVSIRRGVTSAMWAGSVWTLALEAILGLAALTAYWIWRVL